MSPTSNPVPTVLPAATPRYLHLVMEGGGVLQFAYLGALAVLEQQQLLAGITHFAGTSAGSMMAGFLACGMTIADLETTYSSFSPSALADRSTCVFKAAYGLWRHYGLYKGQALYEWYGQVLQRVTGDADITFSTVLQRYGHTLVVTGTNLDQQCTVYFNPQDNPDMPIRQAIRISCSYPFYFQAVQYQGATWCDGGLLDNFPIDYFDSDSSDPTLTLGLKLVTADEYNNRFPPVSDFTSYLDSVIQAVTNQALKIHISQTDWTRTVKIDTGTLSALDFTITTEQIQWLKNQGQVAMSAFLVSPTAQPEDDSVAPNS